jgi:hypothetical protein
MKVILSSKQLAQELSKIDFDTDRVVEVEGESGELCIDTQLGKTIRIICEVFNPEIIISQESRRWDWVYKLAKKVDEQPIVLDISENSVNIIFSY